MSNGVYGHDCRGTLVQDTGHGDILLYRDRMSSFTSRWLYKLTPDTDPAPVDLTDFVLELTLHDTVNGQFVTVPVAPDAEPGTANVVVDPLNSPELAEFLAPRREGKWHLNAYRNGWSDRISDGYWVVTP